MSLIIFLALTKIDVQAEISWPKLIGVASCKWVLPTLTTSLYWFSSFLKLAIKQSRDGINLSLVKIAIVNIFL